MLGKGERETIYKYALKNAYDYGSAKLPSVLSRVLPLMPRHRKNVKDLAREVVIVVDEVNRLDRDQIEVEYHKYEGEFREEMKKKDREGKPKLTIEGAEIGKVITRFAPEPSGYMHIGHSSAAFIARELADIYKGKCYLYFDDTNPEKEKAEYVDAFKRDLAWLGIKFDKEYYASDRIDKMYKYARELMERGRAYVCTCSGEKVKEDRFNRKACGHRDAGPGENLDLFDKMLGGEFDEGGAIVRFKGETSSDNTALRDPTILRIKKVPHYRQAGKYIVWPNYDLNTPINDSLEGVTDALRTREYELRDALYFEVLDALGLRKPRLHLHARTFILGQPKGKRFIKELIDRKSVLGWDDPRLTTIAGLRRRGVDPQAIKDFVLDIGMSKNEGTISIEKLLAGNRKIIDHVAKHLYFVENPIMLTINNAAPLTAKLMVRKDSSETREYKISGVFYVSKVDANGLIAGDMVRLKDLTDARVVSTDNGIICEPAVGGMGSVLQWVSEGNYLPCSVLIPGMLLDGNGNMAPDSLKVAKGYVEKYAGKLEEHDIVQFERFGYCILDDKEKMQFILASK